MARKTDQQKTRSRKQAKQDPAADRDATLPKTSKKIARKFSSAVCLLLLLAMCAFWLISNYNIQNLLQQQADRLGQTLALQTASQLTELVLANDLISINVVLGELINNSSIAEITVLNVDNEFIASVTAVPRPVEPLIPLPVSIPVTPLVADYTAPIALADSVAGYIRLTLDLSYIEVAMIDNLLMIGAATIFLLLVAALLTSTYYQYLVSFPARLLAFSISNIRKGTIETCPEPKNNNEITSAIRQFNATAEFLAQNTFLNNFATRQPEVDTQDFKVQPGTYDVTLLAIRLSNFHFLASTLSEESMVSLLNKFYFFAGKISQLYNGTVDYCSEGEVIVNFAAMKMEEEQAFYAICAAQLFLQLIGDLRDTGDEKINAKFKLAVHSGQAVNGLYSPITQTTNNLTGKTLDLTREICSGCPDNSVLISHPAFHHAGAGSRIEADQFIDLGETEQVKTYIGLEPMAEYRLLLERQAIQLITLYSD